MKEKYIRWRDILGKPIADLESLIPEMRERGNKNQARVVVQIIELLKPLRTHYNTMVREIEAQESAE